MASILRMIIVLSLLCAISGFALSYLKISTAEKIEEQVLTYVQGPALDSIFPEAENTPMADRHTFSLPDGRNIMIFPAKKNGQLFGVALESSAVGYGGDLGVMVGFDTTRDALVGIGITTMRETPGIGSAVAEPGFTSQFVDAELPVDLSSQGGVIDAVSGATVSSTGAVQAVKNATADYTALKDQILAEWP